MTSYNASATDQYMLSVLVDEFSVDEADNALTALTTLTTTYPELFPSERTFARPDHQPGTKGAAGVRFVVFGETGVERMIRMPRAALASLKDAINTLYEILAGLIRTAAA
jgi:hypothetical protein